MPIRSPNRKRKRHTTRASAHMTRLGMAIKADTLTEQWLRSWQARLAGILDIADDALISVDHQQRIALFNQGAEKIFGYTASSVLGQPLDLLLPSRFRSIHHRHLVAFATSPDTARRMGERQDIDMMG